MEKRGKQILLGIILGLMFIQLAAPVSAGFFNFRIGNWDAGDALNRFFGTVNIENGQQFLIWLAIFVIILVASADILSTFTTFSDLTSWVIGFGLALITSVTGVTEALALTLFSAVAAWGAIAISLVIASGFAAAIVVHLAIGEGLAKWVMRRKIMMKAAKGEMEAEAGLRTLRGLGKATTK